MNQTGFSAKQYVVEANTCAFGERWNRRFIGPASTLSSLHAFLIGGLRIVGKYSLMKTVPRSKSA